MLDFGFYNRDCMKGMKEFPDKYFDLAIVDPPYGISITQRHPVKNGSVLVGGVVDHSGDYVTTTGKSKTQRANLNFTIRLMIPLRQTVNISKRYSEFQKVK